MEHLMQLTYKLRLRDKHCSELNRQSRAVNLIWNYCNEMQRKAVRNNRRWFSGFDLSNLAAGTSKELDLHAHTIQQTCIQYARSREQHKKPWLKWRNKKSLGWVPFSTGHVSFNGSYFKFRGKKYETMHLRDIPIGAKIAAGSFNADNRGRWYLNITIDVEYASSASINKVGIDLGLKTLATLSTREKVDIPQFYRKNEKVLALVQRAHKSRRIKSIHAKIKNRRKDFLHKVSNSITKNYGLIVVGDVSPSKLAKTNMAKSVLDASWASFKNMLSYKSIKNGGTYLEVNEAYSSQICSNCGTLPSSRPRGIADLGIREWKCSNCGSVHNRDINAACNILRLGQQTLVGGFHV